MAKDIIPENGFDLKLTQAWETVNAWGWREFISLSECFEKFNVPSKDNIMDRVKNNLMYYRTNYMALYALFLIITAISCPKFAIMNVCIAVMWLLPFVFVPHPFVIAEYRFTPTFIFALTSLVTALTLLIGKKYFSYFLGVNLFFILLVVIHALFRNDSLKSRVKVGLNEKIKEMVK